MKPITFPFKVRKNYRRAFMLEIGSYQHYVEVVGNQIFSGGKGVYKGEYQSDILDFIAESIMSVRKELGK